MPLLKFKCDTCDTVFEELISSDETAQCPACGSGASRHYQGKCYFGSGAQSSGCAKTSCSGCSGGCK